MKKLIITFVAVIFCLSGITMETVSMSGPDKNFLIVFRGNWVKFQYAVVKNVTTSTSSSNIIHINQGGPGILFSPNAFLNTTPPYTLGYVRATIVVYNSDDVPLKSATVQINNIFYYDYPLNMGAYRYFEYYIPNSAWQLYMVPVEDDIKD